MSSSVHLKFPKVIPLEDWNAFCLEQVIEHSSNTIGGNAFYYRGKFGVEIWFGAHDFSQKTLPFHPPKEAREIVVKTFFMGDLKSVAYVAKRILERWQGKWEASPELEGKMAAVGEKA